MRWRHPQDINALICLCLYNPFSQKRVLHVLEHNWLVYCNNLSVLVRILQVSACTGVNGCWQHTAYDVYICGENM